jgi:hypothetical protein
MPVAAAAEFFLDCGMAWNNRLVRRFLAGRD